MNANIYPFNRIRKRKISLCIGGGRPNFGKPFTNAFSVLFHCRWTPTCPSPAITSSPLAPITLPLPPISTSLPINTLPLPLNIAPVPPVTHSSPLANHSPRSQIFPLEPSGASSSNLDSPLKSPTAGLFLSLESSTTSDNTDMYSLHTQIANLSCANPNFSPTCDDKTSNLYPANTNLTELATNKDSTLIGSLNSLSTDHVHETLDESNPNFRLTVISAKAGSEQLDSESCHVISCGEETEFARYDDLYEKRDDELQPLTSGETMQRSQEDDPIVNEEDDDGMFASVDDILLEEDGEDEETKLSCLSTAEFQQTFLELQNSNYKVESPSPPSSPSLRRSFSDPGDVFVNQENFEGRFFLEELANDDFNDSLPPPPPYFLEDDADSPEGTPPRPLLPSMYEPRGLKFPSLPTIPEDGPPDSPSPPPVPSPPSSPVEFVNFSSSSPPRTDAYDETGPDNVSPDADEDRHSAQEPEISGSQLSGRNSAERIGAMTASFEGEIALSHNVGRHVKLCIL